MGLVQQELQIIREQLLFVLQNSSQPAARLRLSSNQEVSYSAVTEPLNNIDATQFDAEKINAGKVVNNSGDNSRLQSIVEQDLQQGGVLSQLLPGYEERPAQIEMATLVARSLTQGVPAIAEAGTGTGKSLAYLLPIVRSGKVAIVSTANKALQEQLFYKDIPFVQQHIKPFEAALVKGVNNYVCIDRLETERVGMQFYAKNRDFKRLLDIVNDPESTFSGDFETLGFQLPGDVRSKVATDSDQCAWSKCSFFGECYVRMMRERAERAKVIVVNHTLLLLDAAMDGFLLPERDVIVLDEAHHLEEEATRSFTVTISPMQVQTLLAQRMLKDHTLLRLQDETLQAAEHMWSRLYQVANPGYKGRVNLEAPLEEGLRLATVIADLADSLRKQRPKDMPEREGQLYDKLLKRAQNLAENVRMVFSVAERDKFVYYVERVEASANRVTLQAS
ncbi:MAG: ATP-dependent DNA helicase, partial [Chloroflexota bacterium]|nr:ATP-dependent DNA helicase [Chloroflexota bacterium]